MIDKSKIHFIIGLFTLLFLLAACGGSAYSTSNMEAVRGHETQPFPSSWTPTSNPPISTEAPYQTLIPSNTAKPTQSPTISALSWSQAQTAAARGTSLEAMTIETETPLPRILPTAPPGMGYFNLLSNENGEAFLLYDPIVWRIVTGDERLELLIYGDSGLANRSISECEIFEEPGRGWGGEIRIEEWPLERYGLRVEHYIADNGTVQFILISSLGIYIDVANENWELCLAEAKEVIISYTFIVQDP